MIRPVHLVAYFLLSISASSARSVTDSLEAIASRLSDRVVFNRHASVAVIGLNGQEGSELNELLLGELTYQLARKAQGFKLVERSQLDVVLREHRLSASGTTQEVDAVQLGCLASASAIITGRILPVDKRHVLLELKLLHTETALLEDMERSVIDVPEGFNGTTLQRSITHALSAGPARRNGLLEVHAGLAYGDHFGRMHPGIRTDLWFRSGRSDGEEHIRIPGAIALGLRLQFMPDVGGDLPSGIDFGHIADMDEDPFAIYDPFATQGAVEQGDVFLVPAGDLSHGAGIVMDALAHGSDVATWQQIHAVAFRADRLSLMVPVRFYLGSTKVDRTPKLFTEIGLSTDLFTMHATYDVISLTGTDTPSGDVYTVRSYRTSEGFTEDLRNNAMFWGGMLGAGVEWGRFSVTANWQRSLHATPNDFGRDLHKVNGDPIGIALLNGRDLDEPQVLDEIAAQGAIRFGTTNYSGLSHSYPAMDRFLDKSSFTISVGVRLF